MADTSDFSFDPIEDALEAFGKGEFVVVMDDESRENEVDLCIAASEITTEKMAFFIRHTRWVGPLTLVHWGRFADSRVAGTVVISAFRYRNSG